ncbi:MAG: hypothetical protein J3K34DRAFT_410428 [Monoraphidium minutum]|nr:MAG: hypothetical protein J3K34DRAFT_410428 [Monoraphidium minutum]
MACAFQGRRRRPRRAPPGVGARGGARCGQLTPGARGRARARAVCCGREAARGYGRRGRAARVRVIIVGCGVRHAPRWARSVYLALGSARAARPRCQVGRGRREAAAAAGPRRVAATCRSSKGWQHPEGARERAYARAALIQRAMHAMARAHPLGGGGGGGGVRFGCGGRGVRTMAL